MEPPKASCCWPVAELKADILPPSTAGELPLTLNLGFSRATLEKQIAVRSNDLLTPEVSLTTKPPSLPGSNLLLRALGIRHGQVARKNSDLGSASSRRLPHKKAKRPSANEDRFLIAHSAKTDRDNGATIWRLWLATSKDPDS